MTEIFYGDWSLIVGQLNPAFDIPVHQRFRIKGSDSSDGVYLGTPGATLTRVSGREWSLALEWVDSSGSGWTSSGSERLATFTLSAGLVISVVAVDLVNRFIRDPGYDDMVIICTSLDPTINPGPVENPYDFTLPEETTRRHR